MRAKSSKRNDGRRRRRVRRRLGDVKGKSVCEREGGGVVECLWLAGGESVVWVFCKSIISMFSLWWARLFSSPRLRPFLEAFLESGVVVTPPASRAQLSWASIPRQTRALFFSTPSNGGTCWIYLKRQHAPGTPAATEEMPFLSPSFFHTPFPPESLGAEPSLSSPFFLCFHFLLCCLCLFICAPPPPPREHMGEIKMAGFPCTVILGLRLSAATFAGWIWVRRRNLFRAPFGFCVYGCVGVHACIYSTLRPSRSFMSVQRAGKDADAHDNRNWMTAGAGKHVSNSSLSLSVSPLLTQSY